LRKRIELHRDAAIARAAEMSELLALLGDGSADQETEDVVAAFSNIF
jgi:hypothetical protein